MISYLVKVGAVVLAAATITTALPSIAGDFRGGRGFVRPPHGMSGGFGHFNDRHRFDFRRGLGITDNRLPFDRQRDFRRKDFARRDPGRNDRFNRGDVSVNFDMYGPYWRPRLASSANGTSGSTVTIISTNQPDWDSVGNYAGANSVLQTRAGTYVTSSGFGPSPVLTADHPRSTARVVDVATMADPCSHEQGVCVIRP